MSVAYGDPPRAPVDAVLGAVIDATREGRGTRRAPKGERWIHITVRDVYGRMASATVVSYPYVEFLHLAKFEDRWRIVSTIWELREGYLAPQV